VVSVICCTGAVIALLAFCCAQNRDECDERNERTDRYGACRIAST
jgi:hypothetical protein